MTTNLSCLKCLLRQIRMVKYHNHVRGMANQECSTTNNRKVDKIDGKSLEEVTADVDELVEPTTCCMSGCVNCVWIEYAEKLSKSMENSSEDVQKIIMEKVQDPNMRAFLSLELRCRKLIE